MISNITCPDTSVSIPQKQINYGIEILRILSMLFIIVLHVIGQGGIAGSSMVLSSQYKVSYIMLALCYCAVNCYALISGYTNCTSKFKLSRLASLWLSVISINAIIWVCASMLTPEWISLFSFRNIFLPVSLNQYWYFTAYVGLMILMPALNAAVNNIPKKQYKFMLAGMFVLFSLLPMIFKSDIFFTHQGYSMLWIILMYLTGAYFKLHFNIKIPFIKTICFAIYILSGLALAFHKFYKEKLLIETESPYIYFTDYYSYTSLFVIICSLALFVLFININVKNKYINTVISFFSKSTFGVYIIHTNLIVWVYILGNRFINLSCIPVYELAFKVILATLIIFLVCTLIERVRMLLFKVLYIDRIVKLLDKII